MHIRFKQTKRRLPTRLYHTREIALERLLPETDAAETKAAHEATRATAYLAAVAHAHSIFAATFLDNHRFLCHKSTLSYSPKLAALKRHIH
jgi:hypothetical protein